MIEPKPKVKTVQVKPDTHERLKRALRNGESYGDLIERIMDAAGIPPLSEESPSKATKSVATA